MSKQSEEQKMMRKWWVLVILAAIFLIIAYGFASLAIDSGSLWQYAVAIIFSVWAVKYIVRGVRLAVA